MENAYIGTMESGEEGQKDYFFFDKRNVILSSTIETLANYVASALGAKYKDQVKYQVPAQADQRWSLLNPFAKKYDGLAPLEKEKFEAIVAEVLSKKQKLVAA